MNAKRKNILTVLVFFAGFYISLNVFDYWLTDLLGIVFLILGLYGVLAVKERKRFVF